LEQAQEPGSEQERDPKHMGNLMENAHEAGADGRIALEQGCKEQQEVPKQAEKRLAGVILTVTLEMDGSLSELGCY
ncbi:hypothetical protein XENOCAPTIV_010697, partial [Xenoophorus captivus]